MDEIYDRPIPEAVDTVADDPPFNEGKGAVALRETFAPAAEKDQYDDARRHSEGQEQPGKSRKHTPGGTQITDVGDVEPAGNDLDGGVKGHGPLYQQFGPLIKENRKKDQKSTPDQKALF